MDQDEPRAEQFGIDAMQWQRWLELARRYDHNQATRSAIKHFKASGKRPPRKDQPLFTDPPPGTDS